MSTTTLTFEHKVDGVLTDLDAAPTLSESTATYGVRRTDTNATVVADNTSMTKQSTGIYTYTIDPDPATGLTYEWWVEAVYNTVVYYFNFFNQGTGSSATLDAVNEMLEILGEGPVTALDTGATSLAGRAEDTLDRENKRIQSLGWAQNTLQEQTYTPDGSSEIDFGSSILRIKPVKETAFWSGRVVIRGTKLHDLEDDVTTFDQDMTFDVVEQITLDEMTEYLRAYIIASAAVAFQRRTKRGDKDDAYARDNMIRAKTQAHREDQQLRNLNQLNTPDARRVTGDRHDALTRSIGVGWSTG